MKTRGWVTWLVGVTLWAGVAGAAEDPGELEIRATVVLSAPARERLAEIVANDAEAGAWLRAKREALRAAERARARPLAVIVYEGRLNTDPERIATVRHLHDMDRVAAWFEVWQASADSELARRCREYVAAWAAVYEPTSNDVNEYKLMPLLVAYEGLRDGFAEADRANIDDWVRRLAERHREAARNTAAATGNRYAKRLGIVATAALILGERSWLDEVVAAGQGLIAGALLADGRSHDLIERDTLTYHTTTLRPLLDIAWLAREREPGLYDWAAPGGGSLRKSVDYVRPYATREKERAEWVNSRAEIDRERAAAGIPHYQPGIKYDPRQAVRLLEEAEVFDRSWGAVVGELAGRPGARFPTWRLVLNAAQRE